LGAASGNIIPVLDQGFEGLFPFIILGPYLLLGAGDVVILLVLFSVGAYGGSLFLNRVLLAIPFESYPRVLRPRVRLREFRSCQITSAPLRYFLNFEDAFYYHVFMKTLLRVMGVYQKGKQNALKLKTTEIAFTFPDLPRSFDNFTILFLSDLHLDGLDGLTERAEELIRRHPVDLCIIGGDLRMESYGPFAEALARLHRLVPAIQARDGIVGIMGNHDCLEMIEPLQDCGMTVLVNDSKAIERNEEKIWIVGVDDPHYFKCHDLDAAFAEVPKGAFSILVAHSNEIYREASAYHPQFYLCGHSHGGQIQIPLVGAVFTHSKAPRSLYYGPWKYERMLGYTSCGVGVSGVPVRFATQGEVLLITLKNNRSAAWSLTDKQHRVIS
jgi:predicted MPP superfamily phosphohydrolase